MTVSTPPPRPSSIIDRPGLQRPINERSCDDGPRHVIVIRWHAVLTMIAVLIIGMAIGMSIAGVIAPAVIAVSAPSVNEDPWNGVPPCTDAIADAGGICHGEPVSPGVLIVPCVNEDSDGDCFWMADTMGNGEGRSFVELAGVTYYAEDVTK
jgi:hypothetical protein